MAIKGPNRLSFVGWNHKFLDYEIETYVVGVAVGWMEKFLRWNHKFLDYEIETMLSRVSANSLNTELLES